MSDNGWISCEDRLPEHGQRIMAYGPGIGVHQRCFDSKWGNGWSLGQTTLTHWQPLPAPPVRVLTKEEALREAVDLVQQVVTDGRRSIEYDSYTISIPLAATMTGALPRLRAALTGGQE